MSTKTIPSVFCAITVLVALLCEPILAQGNCQIVGINDDEWTFGKTIEVLDEEKDDIFKGTTTNVMVMDTVTQAGVNSGQELYMKPKFEGSEFIISPTELFAEYEENETLQSYGLTIDFTCASLARRLIIRVSIKDTNNHAPEFLPGDNYDYKILTPMPPGIPVSTFYGAIQVRDYDLTTKSIIFGIDDNDFLEMEYDKVDGSKKVHTGILKTKSAIFELVEPLVLRISATDEDDTEDLPITSYATITLTSDPLTQLPTAPQFSSPYYSGTIEDGRLTFDEIIKISDSTDVSLSVDGEYFSVTNEGNTITISIKGTIPEEVLTAKDHFLFSLFAEKENTKGGSAAIYISIPKELLKFEKSSYKGSYDEALSIEGIVLEGYNDKVEVHLSGDNIEFFDFTIVGSVVQIITKDKLPEEVVEGTNNRLVLLLEATSTNAYVTTTILIELPEKEVLKFEKSSYKGSYDEELSIEGIVLEGYSDKVELLLSGDSIEFFDFTIVGSVVQIITKDKLPEEVVEGTNNRLVLLLEATSTNAYVTTTILIELPEKEVLKFEKSSYKGSYDEELSIEGIVLEGYSDKVELLLSGDSTEFFDFTIDGNTVQIITKDKLPEDVVDGTNNRLVLLLEATSRNDYVTTTILIELPEKVPDPVIEFEEIAHQATYIYSDKTFSLEPIQLKPGFPPVLNLELSGDAKEYFTAELQGNSVKISTSQDIPESLAAENPYTVLTLQASAINSISTYAFITVALVVDPDPIVEFVEIVYKATYTYSDKTFSVDPIELKPGFPSDLALDISGGDAKEYFTAELQGDIVILGVLQDIPESLAADSPYTVLTLQASATNSINAYAVITVALVIDPDPIIEFVEIVHKATYTYSDEIFSIDPIGLKPGFPSDLVLDLSGSAKDYFTAELQGNDVILKVSQDIPESLAADSPYTVLTLQASASNSINAYAVINVALVVDPVPDSVIEFVEIVHKATYVYSDKTFSIDPIELKPGFPTDLVLDISGSAKDYFTAELQGNDVILKVSQDIPESLAADSPYTVLTLQASATNSINAYAVINVALVVDPVPDSVIEFVEIVHKATYVYSDKTFSIDPIELKPGFPTDLVLDISGSAKDYFTAELQGNDVILKVSQDIPESLAADSPYAVLTLQASSAANSVNAYAVITVELLLEDPVPDPIIEFEEIVHKATYTYSDKIFSIDPIQLKPGFPSDLKLDLSGDAKDYFIAELQGDGVKISASSNIPESLATDSPYTVLTLQASSAAKSVNAYAVITVELLLKDRELVIEFVEIVHQASYSFKENILTISPIQLKSGFPSDIAFEFSGDAKEYFTAKLQGDSVMITTSQDIPESLAADSPYTVLTLKASAANSVNAYTVITVALVDGPGEITQTILEFENPLYDAIYSENHEISVPDIKLTKEVSGVTFELSGDHASFFEIIQDGSSVKIEVQDHLTDDILSSNSHVALILEAKGDNAVKGVTVINVELPKKGEIAQTILVFENPLYDAIYSENHVISVPDIKLTEEVTGVTFELSGDYASFFEIKQEGSTINIVVNDPLTDDILSSKSHIALILEAKGDNAVKGVTVINVELPKKGEIAQTILVFENPLYDAIYSENHVISVPDIKLTEEVTGVTFELLGDYASFFEIKQEGSTINIVVKDPLTDDILSSKSHIALILEARGDNAVKGVTVINVELPKKDDSSKKVVKFEKPLYQGTYSAADVLVLEPAILTDEFSSTVTVSLSTDFEEYFTTAVVGSTVTISLRKALTSDILDKYSVLSLVLEAQVVGAINGHTIISITLPEHEDGDKKVLKFEKNFYDAAYLKENTLIIPLVKLTEEVPGVEFQILGANANLFIVTQDGSTVKIALKEAFPDDVLNSNSYVALVIEAKADGAVNGQTVINIALPTKDEVVKPTMTFQSPYYQASYSGDNHLTIPKIALITGSPANAEFKLSGDNAAFFTATSEDRISVNIEVTTPLTEDILSENAYIVIVLEANAANALDGLTIINIALPKKDDSSKKVVKFEKPLYQGTYSAADVLVLEPAILTDEFSSTVTVSLSTDFEEYFTTAVVGSTVTISLRKALTSDILDKYSVLSLVLEAQVVGAINGHTIISITLPEHEDGDKKVLKFEKNFYDAAYLKENTLIIPLVKLTEEVPGVEFQILGANANLFIVTQDGSTVKIALKEAFPDDVLNSNSYVALVIEAKADGAVNGQTVINIALPTKDEVVKPTMTFESPYYQASYSGDNHLTIPKIALITGSPANAEFKLSGDNAAFFTATSEDRISVNIEVTTPLTEDILSENAYIVIVLEANAANALDGLTIINIALPKKDDSSKKVVKFEKPLYQGTYSAADVLVLEPAILTDEFSSTVTVSLSTDFEEYFTTAVVGSTVTISLRKALTSDILDKYSVLSLVLEAQVVGAINGHTIISITLPEHEDGDKKVLKFEKNFYDAAYLKENTLIIPLVKLTEEVPGVEFQILGANANLFIVTQDGSTVKIALKEAFPDDVLNSNSYVALVIEAKADGAVNGQTVINIALPTKDEVVKPTMTFESPYYQASYSGDNHLTIPKIALITGSPANAEFKLSGDNAAFFTATSEDRISVNIEVTTPLTEDILSENAYIVIVLEANAANALDGLTIINIALPKKDDSSKKVVKFEKPLYQGTYSAADVLVLEPAILTDEFSSTVTVSLSTDFEEYFTTAVVGSTVTISLRKALTSDILDKYSILSLVLEAQVVGAINGHTIISITLPEHEDGDKKVLKFEKNFYDAAYLKENTLIIPLVKLTEEVPGVEFQILGDNANLFIVTQDGSTVNIALKEAFTEDVLNSNSYVALVVEAKADGAVNGQTVINVALPTIDEIVKPTLTFEFSNYLAKYTVDNQLDIPKIALIKGSSAQFKLSGNHADFFTATSEDGISVTIKVTTPLTEDILSENSYMVIVLEAEAPNALDGLTIIYVELPEKDQETTLKFEENFYTGSYAFSTNHLTLSDITLEEGYSTDVEFTLVGEYSQLFKSSAIGNVVTVDVIGTIPENILEQASVLVFSLQATKPDAPAAATAIVIKLIRKTGNPGNALTIIDILEGEEHDHLDIGELDDGCKYRIVSKWPTTTPDWFYTDSEGTLKSYKVLREDPSVADLYLSQTQLEMAIDCDSKPTQQNLREEREEEERFWISTKNINLEENKKLVTIIIRDINNNPPVFDVIGPVTVGFPAKEIAYVLRPQSVITVHATDADIDQNAHIKYTTESDHFAIHPDTGVVYPKSDLYSLLGTTEELSFTVMATDQYGEGHEVSLEIKVKSLDESHIVVVRIEDGVMENINEIVEALSSQTKYAIKLLSATVLPDSDSEAKLGSDRKNKASLVSTTKKDLSGDDTELTMFIYALDSQNNFVTASEVSSLISSGNEALPFEVKGETLSESSILLSASATSDNTGLIVGISVLGALLFITLAGIVVYYFLVIRKKYSSFTNSSGGSSVTSSEDSEDRKSAEVAYENEKPVTLESNENLASTLSDVINPSFNAKDRFNTDKDLEANNAHPKGENSSDIDDDEYGASASTDRKRSIRFNPKVLQIDIDTSDLMEDERL